MSGMTPEEVDQMLAELRQQFEEHGPPSRVQTGVDSDDDGATFHVLTRWHLADGHVAVITFKPTDERSAEVRASLLARTIRRSFTDAGVEVLTDPGLDARARAALREDGRTTHRTTPKGTSHHGRRHKRRR